MTNQAEVRKAHIDITELSRVVAGTSALSVIQTNSKVGRYVKTIYAQHSGDLTPATWMQVLLLIRNLLDFVQENLIDASGGFYMPWWKFFTVFSFMRVWAAELFAVLRKPKSEQP